MTHTVATTSKRRRAIKSEDAPPYVTETMTDDQIIERAAVIAAARMDNREVFGNPAQSRMYLIALLRPLGHEVFGCLLLDSQHKLIRREELFRGTIDGASVYPREVVKSALLANAAAVVFYHNHPSGLAEPSTADRTITRRLVDALALIDVRVLDHIVCGATDSVSFAERGLL